jgi:hypothetical protein
MDLKPIVVNGYDTYFVESHDDAGKHLLIAIPANAGNDISDICGTFVNGHLIRMIDYTVSDGIRFIKAYY